MLRYITHEKVEEVIRLVERAQQQPHGRADDPRRESIRPDAGACQPLVPQPEPDWAHAVRRYLADLSDEAVAELAGLYRAAAGDDAQLRDAADAARADRRSHAVLVGELCGKDDLALQLRRALDGVQPGS